MCIVPLYYRIFARLVMNSFVCDVVKHYAESVHVIQAQKEWDIGVDDVKVGAHDESANRKLDIGHSH